MEKYSESIKQAGEQFTVLKKTINLAEKYGFNLLYHKAKFTKSKRVYQHLFQIGYEDKTSEWWTNQELLGYLQNIDHYHSKKK